MNAAMLRSMLAELRQLGPAPDQHELEMHLDALAEAAAATLGVTTADVLRQARALMQEPRP